MSSPRAARLHRPAQWLRHARTLLAWPDRNPSYFPSQDVLARATDDVSSIAEAVARFEPVTLLASRRRLRDAQRRFGPASTTPTPHRITIHPVRGDALDLWMRDIGPTYVVKHYHRRRRGPKEEGEEEERRSLCGVDFNFNGWGDKFSTPTTAHLARTLLRKTQTERVPSSIVTEGGALETDGEGTLLATESSILNPNRNPGRTRRAIEAELRRALGVDKIIWIPGRKDLDTTDCHVDALARFARPGTVLLSRPNGAGDTEWARVYSEAREVLLGSTDARGRKLDLVDIPEPDPSSISIGLNPSEPQAGKVVVDQGCYPPVFSYVNFLFVNGGVVMPQFGDREADAEALGTMQSLFGSDRQIAPVLIRELPLLGGGIHCATQEVPCLDA